MFREPGLTVLSVPEDEAAARFDRAEAEGFPLPGPDDPAYLFFTSGATGIAKPVVGRQKGLSHLLTWQRETFGIGPDDRSAQLTGVSFDVVLRDIFLPLTSGAALHLPAGDDLGADSILPWLAASGITVLHTVPSLASLWIERVPAGVQLTQLRWTFFAGEPLPESLVTRWRESFPGSGEIVNLYGPTETTLAKCFYRVPSPPDPGNQPVGFPLPQTQVLLLGSGDRLCGSGEPGEVVLRTPLLSLGYRNAPDETRQRFRRNPFRDDDEDLVYFTGDRVRYRPDGALELLGRVDDQVKIRGIRVEPEEVRALLARLPGVRSCAVLAREDSRGDRQLVAYVVAAEGSTVSPRELRRELERQLPDFMVPAAFVMLAALPLTPNGKLDRSALPAPGEAAAEDHGYVAPRDVVEEKLVRLWEDLLDVRPIGVRDDFFERGGHSLLILRLRVHLEESLGRTLPVADFFRSPTIEKLAAALRGELETVGSSPLVPLAAGGSLPPFFWVHPAGGDAAVYKLLVERMGPEQPPDGFQAKGLEDGGAPHRRIEGMARSYVAALRTVQPHGPYRLGGWSFGGRVAFEMAQQLTEQGEPVAALVLLDTGSPIEAVPEVDSQTQTADILALLAQTVGLRLSAEDLLPLDFAGQLARVAGELMAAGLVADRETALTQLRRRVQVMEATAEAALHHEPQTYAGRIIYVRAGQLIGEPPIGSDELSDLSRGWSRFSSLPVAVYRAPGDHHEMLREPYVQELTEILCQALSEAAAVEGDEIAGVP